MTGGSGEVFTAGAGKAVEVAMAGAPVFAWIAGAFIWKYVEYSMQCVSARLVHDDAAQNKISPKNPQFCTSKLLQNPYTVKCTLTTFQCDNIVINAGNWRDATCVVAPRNTNIICMCVYVFFTHMLLIVFWYQLNIQFANIHNLY